MLTPIRSLRALCLASLLLGVSFIPAQAQMDDGELPTIDFAVNLMQSGQSISVDQDDTDPISGFHRVRAGLNASVQFSDRVSALLMIEQEPNDFGGISGASQFQPQIDFVIMDLALSDQLTFRTGTPVTGLMNFRGFSDGPVVQGNPLIGNSPADMITAGQGLKLVGSYENFGFDLTVNRGFGESLTTLGGQNTGLNFIGKFRYTGSDVFKIGAGAATQTGQQGLVFAQGDGENYNVGNGGGPAAARNTHAAIPNETILHADAKVTAAGADIDAWGGYGTADAQGDNTNSAVFGGIGLKYQFTEAFYAAGRFTYVENTSDAVSDLDNTALNRIQAGIGYQVYEQALLKLEYVQQTEQANSLGQIGTDWSGVLAELSFAF